MWFSIFMLLSHRSYQRCSRGVSDQAKLAWPHVHCSAFLCSCLLGTRSSDQALTILWNCCQSLSRFRRQESRIARQNLAVTVSLLFRCSFDSWDQLRQYRNLDLRSGLLLSLCSACLPIDVQSGLLQEANDLRGEGLVCQINVWQWFWIDSAIGAITVSNAAPELV